MAYRKRSTGCKRKASSALSARKTSSNRLKDGSVPEKVIQKQILDWLRDTGLLHWRANSGVLFYHGRRIFLGPDGMPDIVVIAPPTGRFVGLEVKSANGRLRKDQVVFAKSMTDSGALFFVVRSLNDAKAATAQAMGKLD